MDKYTAVVNSTIAKGIATRTLADAGVALRLRCVANPESSGHYADAVLVSATSLTLSVDGVADSTVGSSGVLAFATYTTLGALVDAIQLSSNWEAEIVAGLRSDTVNGSELLARSTSTFRMYAEVSLTWDSSDNGVLGIDFLLEPERPFAFARGQATSQHRVGFKGIIALVNSNAGEDINVVVSEVKPGNAAIFKTLKTIVCADNTVKDTLTDNDFLAHADYGNSILVRFRGTGWIDTAAYLEVGGVKE